ncbi:glucosamine-6-phosphate deaminase [Cytobacillus sp. FJAT-54145]|uniref:Glucosamine-6-phosphate deaminase n=1 Tax=Cytobacillus spartinae TaxID=3299023 RepID=A0ABW6KBH0_9BACI
MKIIKTANYEEMGLEAAKIIIEKVRSNPGTVLGLATGSTPRGVYKYMVDDHQQKATNYEEVRTVNLDEYVGLPETDENSYHFFMKQHLFNHLNIPKNQTFLPSGVAENLDVECKRYEKLIKNLGGVDLQILGIGRNGHIGFNEPGTSFKSRTQIVDLAESTRMANARFFTSYEDVPTKAITVGISTILDSKEILLLASGSSKAEAIKKLLEDEANEQFPASALKHHDQVTIIADEEALQLVEKERLSYDR